MTVRAVIVAREVLASIRAQRVTSFITLALLLAATTTVLVTAGRNAGAEAAVLAQIDAVGTRTLTVRAKGGPTGLNSSLVSDLARYDAVESVTGFGTVIDVTAAANPSGTRVGLATVYGTLGGTPLTDLTSVAGLSQAWATPGAANALGFGGDRGSVRQLDGVEFVVTRTIALPSHLAALDPLVVQPRNGAREDPLTSLVVVADTPQDLPLVTTLVTRALSEIPRDELTVESSQSFADLRDVIGGELTRQSRGIVLGVLAGSAGTSLVAVWSLVLIRRRDFGRRRALGATRTLIVTHVVSQTLILAGAGCLAGVCVGLAQLTLAGHPTPDPEYLGALVTALTASAGLAATVPAVWASRRDPLTELRIP